MTPVKPATAFRVEVVADNPFNAGWVAFVLGLPRPTGQWAALGWDTGNETPSLHTVRYVFEGQANLERPQYIVSAPDALLSEVPQ